jgi:hypothetical protein
MKTKNYKKHYTEAEIEGRRQQLKALMKPYKEPIKPLVFLYRLFGSFALIYLICAIITAPWLTSVKLLGVGVLLLITAVLLYIRENA